MFIPNLGTKLNKMYIYIFEKGLIWIMQFMALLLWAIRLLCVIYDIDCYIYNCMEPKFDNSGANRGKV